MLDLQVLELMMLEPKIPELKVLVVRKIKLKMLKMKVKEAMVLGLEKGVSKGVVVSDLFILVARPDFSPI